MRHISCVGIIAMFMCLYPALSHAERLPAGLEEANKENHTSYWTSNLGFFTKAPLFLIADTDNTSASEDIIFGFDSTGFRTAKEKMRLTDEGRLGIGTYLPDGILDVRAWESMRHYSSSEDDHNGSVTHTVARFGAVRPYDWPGTNDNRSGSVEYYGIKLDVQGQSVAVDDPSDDLNLRTTVGFDLVGVSEGFTDVAGADKVYGAPDLTGIATNRETRALTLEMEENTRAIRVAVGHPETYRPLEALDVDGAVRIGATSSENAGTLRYSDGSFQGYNGSQWLNLAASGGATVGGNDIVMGGGHKIVFGTTQDHRTSDNYVVNSINAPDDDAAHFPIPETGNSYNNDDANTTGGMSLVTGGTPRFTVKGNGNTYVHKRLSIGVGGHVSDTVLTVAGAVHIGPDNLQPNTFDYTSELENYLLWVEDGIVSEDFAIANVTDWSDHVLAEGYELKPLSEVETFIEEQGHLPGVPSEAEVRKSGYTVHEMTRVLLEKVEELTLHAIAQQKILEDQQDEISSLRAQLSVMRAERPTPYVKTGF